MKVNYKMTFGDFVAFSWYYQTHSPVLMGFLLLVAGAGSWVIGRNSTKNSDMVFVMVWFIFMMASLAFMLILTFILTILVAISKKNKTFLTDTVIELTENNIIEENSYGRSELVWGIVQKLKRTRRFILIYIAENKAIVVPKRAFANKQNWDAFYNFLETHRKSRG
jgi:hypothetical protein